MVTLCWRSKGSSSLSAKGGFTVAKWVALFLLVGVSPTGFLVMPVIESPWIVTLVTLSAGICALKTL